MVVGKRVVHFPSVNNDRRKSGGSHHYWLSEESTVCDRVPHECKAWVAVCGWAMVQVDENDLPWYMQCMAHCQDITMSKEQSSERKSWLSTALCHVEERAGIHTDNLGVVQTLRSGESNCTCTKHNDAHCWAPTWRRARLARDSKMGRSAHHKKKQRSKLTSQQKSSPKEIMWQMN